MQESKHGLNVLFLVKIVEVHSPEIFKITAVCFVIFQSLSENEIGVVGAMVVDEVLNNNCYLTHLNLSGKI